MQWDEELLRELIIEKNKEGKEKEKKKGEKKCVKIERKTNKLLVKSEN